jgi:hypothetical protein
MGSKGFGVVAVKGRNRFPCPPARMTAMGAVSFVVIVFTFLFVAIISDFSRIIPKGEYICPQRRKIAYPNRKADLSMSKSKSKTVVVLKTQNSPCFEEAHLILRDTFAWADPANAMVEEANRIILQAENGRIALAENEKRKTDDTAKAGWFLAGCLTGAGICCLGAFLLSLLI